MRYFVRTPWIPSASMALALIGSLGCSDMLSASNPSNCVTSAISCPVGYECSPQTQQCESIAQLQISTPDCSPDPALCGAAKWCDAESGRCLPRRFVLGQPDDRSNLNVTHGLNTPKAVSLVRDKSSGKTKLLVADYGNERTLIWNEVPNQNRPADVVLGQQDLMTTSASREEEFGTWGPLRTPWSIASDGFNLLVAEETWHRVSIWSAIPAQNGASRILSPSSSWGQRNNYLNPKVNAGQTVNALGLDSPVIFAEEGPGRGFYIADMMNRRVLVFDGVPTDPMTPPKWVLGQPDFTSSGARPPQTGFGRPRGLFSDGKQLFVSDQGWHRIVAFNLPITQNNPMPDLVIGQPDLLGTAVNQGGAATASSLDVPTGVVVANVEGERLLWVTDYGNSRILRYRLPSTKADLVLGPGDFITTQPNNVDQDGKRGFLGPLAISTDGVRLVLAEPLNHRVHVWNSLPTQNGQPSDFVLGQASDFSRVANMPPAMHELQFNGPTSVTSDGKRLFVADSGSNRVLIWNRIPKDGNTPPDVVLGQRDFTGYRQIPDGLNASGLYCPCDARSDGTRLAVADTCNNRVLIWNRIPSENYAPADAVLGQSGMNTRVAGTSAKRFNGPRAVLFVDGSLLVSDTQNHRVLRFDGVLDTNALATRVIGQPDMSSNIGNAGEGRTPRGLYLPGFMASDSGRLLIADTKNWRVLVWNQMPTIDFQPADLVIGQKSFYDTLPAPDLLQMLNYAHGILVDAGKLYVSSSWGNRVLIWDKLPSGSGAPASAVLGQDAPSSLLPNNSALAPVDRLSSPMGMAIVNGRIFIADQNNNRVVSRELPQ